MFDSIFPTDRAYTLVIIVLNGRYNMSYKEKIIALLEKVDSEEILKRVYKLLIYLYLKEE